MLSRLQHCLIATLAIVGAVVLLVNEEEKFSSRYNRQFDFIAPQLLAFEEKRTSEHKQSDNADDCDTKVSPMRLYLIIIKIATKQGYIFNVGGWPFHFSRPSVSFRIEQFHHLVIVPFGAFRMIIVIQLSHRNNGASEFIIQQLLKSSFHPLHECMKFQCAQKVVNMQETNLRNITPLVPTQRNNFILSINDNGNECLVES